MSDVLNWRAPCEDHISRFATLGYMFIKINSMHMLFVWMA